MNAIVMLTATVLLGGWGHPSILLHDGRTAWLLADGQEVVIPGTEPFELEVRFHRSPLRGCEGRRAIQVSQGGLTILDLADSPPEGIDDFRQAAGYHDFDLWTSGPLTLSIPAAPDGVTVVRLSGAPCGASVTAPRVL